MTATQWKKSKSVAQKSEEAPLEAAHEDNNEAVAAVDSSTLTPEELAIVRRVSGEDDGWKHPVGEKSTIDYSIGGNPFPLPPPAKKMQDQRKYAFRWIERKKERVDMIRSMPVPRRWWICNSVNTPFLKKHIDPVLGCICLMDQMLVFKPWDHYAKERAMVTAITERKEMGGNLAAKHGHTDSLGSTSMSAAIGRPVGQGNPSREEIRGGDVMMDESMRDVLDAVDSGGNRFSFVDDQ